MSACETENLDILQFLIENGANVNAKNNYGMTPLMLASIGTNLGIVQFLVQNGAYATAVDNNGKTALVYAKEKGNANVMNYLNKLNFQRVGRVAARRSLGNSKLLLEESPFGLDISEKISRMAQSGFGKKRKTSNSVESDIRYLKTLKLK
jgi:ankyrin repeat protein